MRMHLLLILSAFSVAQASPQTDSGAIEGRIVRLGTLEPIPYMPVSLARLNPNLSPSAISSAEDYASTLAWAPNLAEALVRGSNVAPELLKPLSQSVIETDDNGRFSFKDLPPGRYSLRALSNEYFTPPVSGYAGRMFTKTIVIEAGSRTPSIDVFMIKQGIITGQIHDPSGNPVTGLRVEAYQLSYPEGRLAWASKEGKRTDDRGMYRLSVPPGRYYIGVTPNDTGVTPGPRGTERKFYDTWAQTFFPGTSDPTAASPVEVKDGSEVTGIDVDIQRATTTHNISGIATNPLPLLPRIPAVPPSSNTGEPDRSISTFLLVPLFPNLLEATFPLQFQNAIPVSSRPNGEFEIRNVRPGLYEMYPRFADAERRSFTGSPTLVDVRKEDAKGLSIPVVRGVSVSAEVVADGIPASFKLDSLRINLRRTVNTTPEMIALSDVCCSLRFNAAGKITIDDIPVARYMVEIWGLPDTAYVSDVRQGGQSVFDEGFVAGSQQGSLQIIVSSSAGILSGAVTKVDRKPAANATIVLVPPPERRTNTTLFKIVTTDEAGDFSIGGILPGLYTIFAWESVPILEPWLNADFIERYHDYGRSVRVDARSSVEVKLELIPDDLLPR